MLEVRPLRSFPRFSILNLRSLLRYLNSQGSIHGRLLQSYSESCQFLFAKSSSCACMRGTLRSWPVFAIGAIFGSPLRFAAALARSLSVIHLSSMNNIPVPAVRCLALRRLVRNQSVVISRRSFILSTHSETRLCAVGTILDVSGVGSR